MTDQQQYTIAGPGGAALKVYGEQYAPAAEAYKLGQEFGESYTRSYWERPEIVGMHMEAMRANPGMDFSQYGWDPELVAAAYDHMKQVNGGSDDWMNWSLLDPNDAWTELLSAAPAPPPEMQYQGSQFQGVFGQQLDKFFQTPTTTPISTTGGLPQLTTPPIQVYNSMPSWQKATVGFMSNNLMQSAASMLPVSIAGGLMGLAAGPLGAIAGFVAPIAFSVAMGSVGDPTTVGQRLQDKGWDATAANVMQSLAGSGAEILEKLQIPGQVMEQGIGTGAAIGNEMLGQVEDVIPELLWGDQASISNAWWESDHNVTQLLDTLPELWEASKLTYESLAPTEVGTTIANAPAGLEFGLEKLGAAINTVLGKPVEESDVRFANLGEVFLPDSPEPVKVSLEGLALINMARQDILKGQAPSVVVEKYKNQMGLSGQFADLFLQTALDPLNVAPMLGTSAVKGAAKVAAVGRLADKFNSIGIHGSTLELAARIAEEQGGGVVSTAKAYKTLLAGLPVEQMTPAMRRIAGVTEAGTFKELTPGAGARNYWGKLNQLSPMSQATEFINIGTQNADLLSMSAQRPADLFAMYKAWQDLKPGQAAAVAEQALGTPMAYTTNLALKDFYETKIKPIEAIWNLGEGHRAVLQGIVDNLGEKANIVIDALRKGDDVELGSIISRLAEKGVLPEGLDVAGLKSLGEYINANPWALDFDYLKAHMKNMLTDHMTKWTIDAYGIKADPKAIRLAAAAKNIQNIAFLNLNPGYFVRNMLNNTVTRMFDGVMGGGSPMKILDDLHAHGIQPFRMMSNLRSGMGDIEFNLRQAGADDIADLYAKGDIMGVERALAAEAQAALKKAAQGKDVVQTLNNLTGQASSKVNVLARLFNRLGADDATSGMQAHYAGFTKARSQTWRPAIDKATAARLDAFSPGLSAKLEALAKNAKNLDDLDNIIRGTGKVDAGWYVDDVAGSLGMEAGRVREALEATGAMRDINEALNAGKSPSEAFAGVETRVADYFREQFGKDLELQVQAVRDAVKSEGFVAGLKVFEEMQVKLEEFWTRHFDEWERTFDLTQRMPWEQRSAFIEQRAKIADGEWKAQKKWIEKTYQGIADELGVESAVSSQFIDGVKKLHDDWNTFFSEQRRLRKDFEKYIGDRKLDPFGPEARAKYAEIQEKIAAMYNDYGARELSTTNEIGASFVNMFERQFGAGKAAGAAEWWKAVHDIHASRQATMRTFRDWERGVNVWFDPSASPAVVKFLTDFYARQGWAIPPEGMTQAQVKPISGMRHTAWPKFIEEVYLPTIHEYIKAGHKGAVDMWQDLNWSRGARPSSNAVNYFAQKRAEYHAKKKAAEYEAFQGRVTEGRNAGLMGPRQDVAKEFPMYPEVFSQSLSDSMMYAAREMQDLLPAEAIVQIAGEEGALIRHTQNPQWYVDLYDSLGGVDRKAVENALQRIIDDKGKDFIKNTETTILETKRAVLKYMRESGNYPDMALYDLPTPGELIASGDFEGARSALQAWLESDYASKFTDADWNKLTANNFDKLLEGEMPGIEAAAALPAGATVAGVGPVPREVQARYLKMKRAPEVPDPPAVGRVPLGTLDSLGITPVLDSQIFADAWQNRMRPMLDAWQKAMIDDPPITNHGLKLDELPLDVQRQVKAWIARQKQELPQANMAANRIGEMWRDQSLLNYQRRYNFDNFLGVVMPYEFWPTRSMVNWSLRVADKPAILAHFARLANFTNQNNEELQRLIPTRLKGKMRIPVPGMPEWAGGGVYVDPLAWLFPMREFIRPYERIMMQETAAKRKAADILNEWAESGEYTSAEIQQAVDNQSGPVWERAFSIAMSEENGDAIDFMSMFISPASYISMPYEMLKGTPEKIGPSPLSRNIQALAGALGIPGLAKLDFEAAMRKGAGLSEFGEWGDYYIERQVANMAADGLISGEDARIAMIEHSGPAWAQALQRVQQEQALKQPFGAALLAGGQMAKGKAGIGDFLGATLFGWLPGNLLPEGELAFRGLSKEYSAAWKAYNAGDKQAVNNFFEEHPEYEARIALYKEPEERLRQFMISEVWDKWGELNSLDKDAVKEQLGSLFTDSFLTKDTRNYEALDTNTLAAWAQAMGGQTPGMEGVAQIGLQLAPAELSNAFETYNAQKQSLFPGISAAYEYLYSLPEEKRAQFQKNMPMLAAYTKWRDQQLAAHPELIPYVTSEDSAVAHATPEIQQGYYQYRADRANLFPNYAALQDQYFNLSGKSAKSSFLRNNPELTAYWDWQKEYLAWHPELIPFVKSQESIAKAVLGKDYKAPATSNAQAISSQMSSELKQMLFMSSYGYELPSGAYKELRRLWEKNGKPMGDFNKWLDQIRQPYQ